MELSLKSEHIDGSMDDESLAKSTALIDLFVNDLIPTCAQTWRRGARARPDCACTPQVGRQRKRNYSNRCPQSWNRFPGGRRKKSVRREYLLKTRITCVHNASWLGRSQQRVTHQSTKSRTNGPTNLFPRSGVFSRRFVSVYPPMDNHLFFRATRSY